MDLIIMLIHGLVVWFLIVIFDSGKLGFGEDIGAEKVSSFLICIS